MNTAIIDFLIENPSFFLSHFVFQSLPAAGLAYGLVCIGIRPINRSTFNNSILGHLCGIAVTVVGSAIFRIVAIATFAGKNAYVPAIGSMEYFFYMLIVPALVAAGYIVWLKRSALPRVTTMTGDSTANQTTTKQNDTTEKSFPSITSSSANTQLAAKWKFGVFLVVGLVVVSWIATTFIGQHNYIVEDGGEYGYKDDLTKQQKEKGVNKPLRLFRYAGINNGKHQVYVNDINGGMFLAFECDVPCKAMKRMTYYYEPVARVEEPVARVEEPETVDGEFRFPRGTKNPFASFGDDGGTPTFEAKEFISSDSDSVEIKVMEDAINGYLKVSGLNAVTLKYNNVGVEQGKESVPVRPLFSEDGIKFEYLEEQ